MLHGLLALLPLFVAPGADPGEAAGSASMPPAEAFVEEAWSRFRAAYPFPYQAVAVQPRDEGGYAVILSEPPPHVSEDDLRAVLPNLWLKRHVYGFQGWLRDAVAFLEGGEAELAEIVAEVHQLYYETTYKAGVVELPAPGLFASEPLNLDLELGVGNLDDWLLGEDPLLFEPLEGGEAVPARSIDDDVPGLYFSRLPGVVGWWIPGGVPLESCRVSARQFVLDGDLILGAVGGSGGVLVLARERQVPLERLPALRFETLLLLSSIDRDELFQTINEHPFSGPVGEDETWQVNLLSPELHDTEYGALLSITDVLLKSWSEHGFNTVRGFEDYPAPADWPFEKGAYDAIAGDSLVYNYNSQAGGGELNLDGVRVLAVNRTGVLPISYFPGGLLGLPGPEVREAEETAYDWFARQSDPHLVRVSQYSALFQIFGAFGVRGDYSAPPALPRPEEVQRATMLAHLRAFRAGGAGPREAALAYAKDYAQRFDDVIGEGAALEEGLERKAAERWLDELGGLDEAGLAKLADELEANVEVFLPDLLTEVMAQAVSGQLEYYRRLADATSTGASERWIHTPVLIIDHNEGPLAGAIGGHNLVQRVPRVEVDPKVPVGKLRPRMRNGQKVTLVNEADLGRLKFRGGNARPVLANSKLGPLSDVLRLKVRPPAERGLSGARFGWGESARPAQAELDLVAKVRADRPDAAVIVRRGGGYQVHAGRRTFSAPTHREAVDAVVDTTRRSALDVELVGFTRGQAQAFRSSLALRRKAIDRSFLVRSGGKRGALESLESVGQTHVLDGMRLDTLRIVEDGVLHAEIVLPAKRGLAARISLVMRGPAEVLARLKAGERLLEAVRNVLRGRTPAARFRSELRERLRREFKLDVDDLGIEASLPPDLYISDRERSAGARRAA
ncbi:MAG: hypothetical protein AAF682_32225 [Planctomycetota bacterium]